MSKPLHKNFTDGQAKTLFEKYSKKEIKLNHILQILRIKRSRFSENNINLINHYFSSNILLADLIDSSTLFKEVPPKESLVSTTDCGFKISKISSLKSL